MLQRRISQRRDNSQRGRGATRSSPGGLSRASHRLSVYELPPAGDKDPLQFKILVMGAAETEKTKLVVQYVVPAAVASASEDAAAATAESAADDAKDDQLDVCCSWRKRVTIEGVDFILDLRDIPCGESATSSLVDLDIKEADGVMIMYSVDSPASLQEAVQMKGYVTRKRFEREKGQSEGNASIIPIILIGVDHGIKKREIPWEDGKEVALSWQCPFAEITSDPVKITKCFEELVKEIYRYKFTPAGQPVITPAIKEAKKAAFRYTRADAPDLQFVQGGEEDVQPRIKAASLERLVERLTYDKYPYPTLSRTFLLMYRHYTTGQKLMTLLIERFMMTPPSGNVLAQEEWKQRVQTPIRLRVYNLLKLWIAKHFEDFEQDPALTDMLFRFIEGPIKSYNMTCANQLVSLLTEMKVKKDKKRKSLPVMFDKEAPKPKISRKVTMGNFAFKDLNPVELARQLTLMDFRYFKRLTPYEFILWNKLKKHDKPNRAPNIYVAIQNFNALNCLVKSEVVMGDKPKSRALVISRWIQTAQACLELNNFNSVMMIVSALDDCAVHRLKQTWKVVPRKLLKQFQDFKKLVEARGSFHNLRMAQKAAVSPLLPYLGMFLTDLAYVNDATPDYVNSLMNVDKMDQMVGVVRGIQLSFQSPYCLEEVPHIQAYLQRESPFDEQELYRLSCEKEPSPSAAVATSGATSAAPTSLSAKFNAFFSSPSLASASSASATPSSSSTAAASAPTTSPLTSSVSASATTGSASPSPAAAVTKAWSHTLAGSPVPTRSKPLPQARISEERRPSIIGTAPTTALPATPSANDRRPSVSFPPAGAPAASTSTSATPATASSSSPLRPAPPPTAGRPFSSGVVDSLERTAAAMEESGISVPTVQQWLDEIEKKDSSQVFGEYNAYKKALLSSHTLETLIRALLKQPTSLPGSAEVDGVVLQLLSRTLIGGPKFQKELFAGLRGLSPSATAAPLPLETIEQVAALVAHFKTVPLNEKLLADLQELNKKSAEIILLLQKIEDTEGAHSVTLNEEKIEITAVLMELGQVTLKVIDSLHSVDDLGSRRCLQADDEKAIGELATRILAGAPATPDTAKLHEFVNKVRTEAKKLRALDQASMEGALLATANDQLDTIELHFQKLLDQMSLLARRLMKLWDLRRVREVILNTETPGVSAPEIDGLGREKEEIMRKIEITWDQDMANIHKLLVAVTSAEDKFYAFARYYQRLLGEQAPDGANGDDHAGVDSKPQAGGGGKRLPPVPHPERKVSLGNNKELGRVFNYLIRIRKLQKELDDVIAPAGGGSGEGDSDSGDELSLDEVASGSPTAPLSPVTSGDSLSSVGGETARPPRPVGAPPRPSSLISGVPLQPPRPGSPSPPPTPAGPPPPRPSRPPSFPPAADGAPPPLPPAPTGIPPFTGPVPISPRGFGGRGGSVRVPSRSPSVSGNQPIVPIASRPSAP